MEELQPAHSNHHDSELHSNRKAMQLVTRPDIEAAAQRIQPYVVRTPLLSSPALNDVVSQAISLPGKSRVKVQLSFKAEHLQVVGAFKARGAANAIQLKLQSLRESDPSFDAKKLCVLTHSSGNHGAALACQAKSAGVQAAVVMPRSEWVKASDMASPETERW